MKLSLPTEGPIILRPILQTLWSTSLPENAHKKRFIELYQNFRFSCLNNMGEQMGGKDLEFDSLDDFLMTTEANSIELMEFRILNSIVDIDPEDHEDLYITIKALQEVQSTYLKILV